MSIRPDISGQSCLSWRASRFDAEAARGNRDAMALALTTRIAETWFDIIATRQMLAVQEEQVASNKTMLEMVENRVEAGQASSLELLQMKQLVAASRTRLPESRGRLTVFEHRMALLLGALPGRAKIPEPPARLPELPPLPPTGVPGDLLTARPDVRAAELKLRAADTRAAAAVRALFPSLRITGQAGWQAVTLRKLETQFTWGVEGTINVPLWMGGERWADRRRLQAARRSAAAEYRATILTAVQQVETALAEEQTQRDLLQAMERAQDRWTAGLIPYLDVLDAIRTLQRVEEDIIAARHELIRRRVSLYDALGGAWIRELTAREDHP
jgi:multidrug efflux system outer membrane protein